MHGVEAIAMTVQKTFVGDVNEALKNHNES